RWRDRRCGWRPRSRAAAAPGRRPDVRPAVERSQRAFAVDGTQAHKHGSDHAVALHDAELPGPFGHPGAQDHRPWARGRRPLRAGAAGRRLMHVSIPPSLDVALEELAADPQAVALAGGTDLLVAINFGRARPEHVVSIRRLTELQQLDRNGRLRCGAGVTYTRLQQELPGAMALAARTVGSPQIRNAGTL